MSLLMWVAPPAALLAGIGLGWLLRGRAAGRSGDADWMTRVAARDRDLHDLRQELAEVTIALQQAQAASIGSDDGRDPADAIEAELANLRDLDERDPGAGRPDLRRRIEELEVELAALASHGVSSAGGDLEQPESPDDQEPPEPAGRPSPVADQADLDDLTRIAGIGDGLAKVLRSMGISSFDDLSHIDDEAIGQLDQLVGGVRERFERHDWPEAARALDAEKAAAAS